MARGSSLHEKLANEFGGHCATMLLGSLPRLAAAMQSGNKSASFTVTGQISAKRGVLQLEIKPRERVPLETKKFSMQMDGDQLSLLDEITNDEDEGDEGEE